MSPWFLYCTMQIKAHANEVVTDWVGNLTCDQKVYNYWNLDLKWGQNNLLVKVS